MSWLYKMAQVFNLRSYAPVANIGPQWGAGGLGGLIWGSSNDSHAGKPVTVDAALQVATSFACVRLIAQTGGTLPVEIKQFDGRVMVPTREHPLFTLLHDAPNADMSGVEFWQSMYVGLLTWGNAYAEISRVFDRVVALTPLKPALMTVKRGSSGALVYGYSDPTGRREFDERDILHLKYLSADGIMGMSPVAQARHSLGLAMAAEETAGRLFANGMRIGGYVSSAQPIPKSQRPEAEEWLERFRGSQSAGKVPLLPNGWKFDSATMPPAEAELLVSRKFSVEEIARWYGVPPFMVGHTEKSTSWGTGLEQQMLAFHTLTLRPLIKGIEGAIKRRLIAPAERARIEVDFNVEGLLRADSAGRAAFLAKMVEAGIYSLNEARAREGLGPKPGGDDLTMQSNRIPADRLGEATTRAALPAAGDPAP